MILPRGSFTVHAVIPADIWRVKTPSPFVDGRISLSFVNLQSPYETKRHFLISSLFDFMTSALELISLIFMADRLSVSPEALIKRMLMNQIASLSSLLFL